MIQPIFVDDSVPEMIPEPEPDPEEPIPDPSIPGPSIPDPEPIPGTSVELDGEISRLEQVFKVHISSSDKHRFRMSGWHLQFEKFSGEWVSLTQSNGDFYAESTIRNRLGRTLARNVLGIEGTPEGVKAKSRILWKELPTDIEMDELTPQVLSDVADEISKEVAVNTDLDMREILGLDKAQTRIKGELVNNGAKLTELDEHIERELKTIDRD